MTKQQRFGTISSLLVPCAMFALVSVPAHAQQVTVEGLITGRSGPTMSVKTEDTPRLTVVLSDATKATEKGGFLGLDRKDLGITALVPGLAVKVEGTYDPDHKLIAQKVVFSRGSMKTAKQIDAGLHPVNQQIAAQQDQMKTDEKNIETAQQGVDANTKDIANNRFGRMDSYEEKGNITVTFANGKATVSAKDRDQLNEFVKTAANTPGYMIEVQGYASTTGSPALNQKLSAERAEAVLAIIQQSGAVPLTRILAPAAMGTSDQIGDDHSRSGQAQNRRVVVTILVNKGING